MNIIKKIKAKAEDNAHNEGVTLAFLGDSVTQGCFELYKKEGNIVETVFDKRHSYEAYVFEIFCMLYPTVTLNIINAGVSGDRASSGAERVERDVLSHKPDLTVVCYGLNDCAPEKTGLERYITSLGSIFDKLKDGGGDIIFMTPNMMNTKISPHLTDKDYIQKLQAGMKGRRRFVRERYIVKDGYDQLPAEALESIEDLISVMCDMVK